jgi:acyl-coenzyme A synthetase/AMP-(fatty) acid ligase/acyl carrier protein
MSLYEICSALFTASPLVLLDEDDRLDMARLTEIMRSESVARVYLPTAMLQMFAHATIAGGIDLPSLKLVQVAGEALTITPAVREWAKRTGCALLNLYGPTESHVVSDFMLDDAPEQWPAVPSIGGPIANVEFHILDRTLRPQPTGMPGELFIGGHGLAIGYMGRDDLTAERFIEIDPGDGRRRRLYRTGDLARWRPDGTLDYLRRVDAQIKLRGFRIEPGEIEAILAAQDGVADAAVVVMGESNDRHLVAYVVCDGGDALLESLRVTLEHVLPYYMVPSFIVPLPALPLNANGKLDRRALPQPERNMAPRALPQTETEIRLASIWMRLLKLDQVGIDERFFEIGGHSLLATQMVTAVLADFEFKLTIKDVFSHQTIREIAQLIDVLKAYSGSAEKREPESEGELLEETEW